MYGNGIENTYEKMARNLFRTIQAYSLVDVGYYICVSLSYVYRALILASAVSIPEQKITGTRTALLASPAPTYFLIHAHTHTHKLSRNTRYQR